ncbi:unnamed protein product [Clonostachys rosea]|uniref:Rhodopsin domain-containing protein n=1 Tax=Bionectria ochroleuca TaxID=29856 RepID=A0ABY6U2E3_BIOOC|nr:unnamed protein product [Clonostachys rosea]
MAEISISATRGLWTDVSMLILSTLIVAIRLITRLMVGFTISISDWLILLGWGLTVAYFSTIIHFVVTGDGLKTFDLNELIAKWNDGGQTLGPDLMKLLLATNLLFLFAISAIKLSILVFYHQVFSISQRFRVMNYAVAGACLVWLIVSTFVNIFQCKPVSALWEALGSTEYCLASGTMWLGLEVTNLLVDVIILALPVSEIGRLQLSTGKKWFVACIFLLGGLVCVASIARITFLYHPSSPEVVTLPESMLTASVQLGIAILCACLPAYGPALKVLRQGVSQAKLSLGMSVSKRYTSDNSKYNVSKNSGMHDLEASPYYMVQSSRGNSRTTDTIPLNAIQVKKSVSVVK